MDDDIEYDREEEEGDGKNHRIGDATFEMDVLVGDDETEEKQGKITSSVTGKQWKEAEDDIKEERNPSELGRQKPAEEGKESDENEVEEGIDEDCDSFSEGLVHTQILRHIEGYFHSLSTR